MKAVVIIFIIFSILMVGIMLWADYVETREPQYEPIETPKPEPEPPQEPEVVEVYYLLTDAERDLVERVVMAEAQKAVAQCILNVCLLEGLRPAQVIAKYNYAGARPMPTDAIKMAVEAVFDRGEEIIDPETKYFYAPNRTTSAWHESQVYVCTIGGHRFFKEASPNG